MKRLATPLSLLACAALVLSGLAGSALAEDTHVALFKSVSGSIKVQRAGALLDAAPGTTLEVSDRIISGPAAVAGIVFKDGTLLTVGPSSDLQVRDYVFAPSTAKYGFDLYLARGSAVYSSGKIGKIAPETVKVSSPTATVGVRGTRFIIQAE